MSNILIITKREFVSRAFKKKFIIITLLAPLLIAIFSALAGYLISYEDKSELTIGLLDQAGVIPDTVMNYQNIHLQHINSAELAQYRDSIGHSIAGILMFRDSVDNLNKDYKVEYLADGQVSLTVRMNLENLAYAYVRMKMLQKHNLGADELQRFSNPVALETKSIDTSKDTGSEVAAVLGGVTGLLLYLLLIINGSMIMKSVMEEKTNRIIEVMINTVRPIDLMMGKIIGVGLVGIFQVLIWLIMTPLTIALIVTLFGGGFSTEMISPEGAAMASQVQSSMYSEIMSQVAAINWFMVIPLFLVFFFLGYLMYAAMFAAIGSTIGDDLSDSQSLTFIVIMPLILAIYMAFSVIRSPDSPLAFWCSIIPFFSPIVMPARLAFNPPVWQIILSLVILLASTYLFAWLSAKIYRIGILMYGKKATLKDLSKWLRAK